MVAGAKVSSLVWRRAEDEGDKRQLLRMCAVPRFGYIIRTHHPQYTSQPAEPFDYLAWRTAVEIIQLSEDSLDSLPTGPRSTIPTQQVRLRTTLPIRCGGLGIRPMQRILHSVYWSALVLTMPEFVAVFPELSLEQLCESSFA